MPKRPEIGPLWCSNVLANPVRTQVQPNGRIRHWGEVMMPGEDNPRIMRVVTLADGETVHNAFLDRRFKRTATP